MLQNAGVLKKTMTPNLGSSPMPDANVQYGGPNFDTSIAGNWYIKKQNMNMWSTLPEANLALHWWFLKQSFPWDDIFFQVA